MIRMKTRVLKTYIVISVAVLTTALFFHIPQGSSQSGVVFPVRAGEVIANIGLGILGRSGNFSVDRSGGTTIYDDAVYQVQVTETPVSGGSIVRTRVKKHSGERFALSHFQVDVRIPRAEIQGIWYPSSEVTSEDVMSTDAFHNIRAVAAPNYGIPYVAAVAADGRHLFAMGLRQQDLSVLIEGGPGASRFYQLQLTAVTLRASAVFEHDFFISTETSMDWFDTASAYADWVDAANGYQPFPISERAYEPVYDTWYWSGDEVSESLYLETAKQASEVGAGAYLADSGWDAPAGEYAKWLNGKTGDYAPPANKFADLAATLDSIRTESNLAVQLWLQPFAVGRASERYARTRNLHIQISSDFSSLPGWSGLTSSPFVLPRGENLETVNLCPRNRSTQTYLRDLFTEMAGKYKPDGYWLDFIDGLAIYCVAPHVHNYNTFGEGLHADLETIKSTILSTNPGATVHFRAKYANLNNKSFANVWQSEDSPGDFDRMRLNALRLRPFSKGVVFASDQLYWPPSTEESEVAKFIMTSVMVGVPALGPNLTNMAPSTRDMVRAWIDFYRTYKDDLAKGRLSLFGQLRVPNHKIEGKDRTFAYIRNLEFSELAADGKTIHIMNATDGNRFVGRMRGPQTVRQYTVRVFDRYLNPEPNPLRVTPDHTGRVYMNIAVEQGGVIEMTGR